MDKKLIEKIKADPSNTDIERFDNMVSGLLTKEVSKSFTKNVIARVQPSVQKVDGHIWWILLGIVFTAGIWVFGGFGNAAPLELSLPQVSVPAIEMGPLIKGFGFVNIILILLLLDRYFQRRKKLV